jgi:hypothetical protein
MLYPLATGDYGVGAAKVMKIFTRSLVKPRKPSSDFFYSKRLQLIEKIDFQKINSSKRQHFY